MGRLISNTEFTSSPYGGLADNIDNLSGVVARAEAAIERKAGRTFGVTQYEEIVRPVLSPMKEQTTFFVKNRPIQSVVQITHRRNSLYAWTVVDPGLYIVEADPGYITSYMAQWFLINPSGQMSMSLDQFGGWEVDIIYTAGLPTIPDDIKEAVFMQVVLFAYQDTQMYARTDDRPPGIRYMIQDIEDIVKYYRQSAMVFH